MKTTNVPLVTIPGSLPVRRGSATCRWVGTENRRNGGYVVEGTTEKGDTIVVKARCGAHEAQELLDRINPKEQPS